MDSNTAIGLGVFALGAILLGWIVRTFIRALVRGVGPTVKAFGEQQAAMLRAQQQQALGALRTTQAPPRGAAKAPPLQRPRPERTAAAAPRGGAPAALHRHHPGFLIAPFRSGQGLLRSIIVSEALGPPLATRRPDGR